MSFKLQEDIKAYLEENPKAMLKDVLKAFPEPDHSEQIVEQWFNSYSATASKKIAAEPTGALTIAAMVDDYMGNHPDAESADLYKAFPKQKESTLRKYHMDFVNANSETPATEKTADHSRTKGQGMQDVFAYLEKNPNASNQTLYAEFEALRPGTIRSYKTQYFHKQSELGVKKSVPKSVAKSADPPVRTTPAKGDLEARVVALELEVGQLKELLSVGETIKELLGIDPKKLIAAKMLGLFD